MVAVFEFSSGAMENFRLIVYRESHMLYSDLKSTDKRKQINTIVVAHEVAHQWFGNLITMGWGTHLWLNKGFATWISYMVTNILFPEWQIWTQFLQLSADGLSLNALQQSHLIKVEVDDAHGIDQILDDISYKKGSAVIRMLQGYLGNDIVQLTQGKGSRTSNGNSSSLKEKDQEQCDETLWVKVNVEQSGFYRVIYDDELAARLRKAVVKNYLSATDKLGMYYMLVKDCPL
ncbi:hypothetical protein Pint_15379 [Pistacia integerrima]|uniref:Uncharacterized protein n=1 Tax=Pistacia integerrima TaxID=434235 RepID=A0ACC0ZCJ9_9ROSI|nr:hypothetical protein Pint_15379 [Pistacia integerrima]